MSINFNVRVNRWVNFYHFVQNLSEWNPHFRRAANDYWRKHLDIPEGCAAALADFASLHREHSGDSETYYLGRPFYAGSDDPFVELKKDIGTEGSDMAKRTFATIEPYFEKLWNEQRTSLLEWQRLLSDFVNEKERREKIQEDLASFYGADPGGATVTVELAMTSPGYFGGQANFFDERTVRLEVSDELSEKKIVRASGTLWHETVHAIFERAVFVPMAERLIGTKGISPMKEVVNECFFPKGVMAMKFFGAPRPQAGFNRYAKGHDLEIMGWVQETLDSGKPVDETLVKKIWKLIKD